MIRPPPKSPLFPSPTLFRSVTASTASPPSARHSAKNVYLPSGERCFGGRGGVITGGGGGGGGGRGRKGPSLNSRHPLNPLSVFCLEKKTVIHASTDNASISG